MVGSYLVGAQKKVEDVLVGLRTAWELAKLGNPIGLEVVRSLAFGEISEKIRLAFAWGLKKLLGDTSALEALALQARCGFVSEDAAKALVYDFLPSSAWWILEGERLFEGFFCSTKPGGAATIRIVHVNVDPLFVYFRDHPQRQNVLLHLVETRDPVVLKRVLRVLYKLSFSGQPVYLPRDKLRRALSYLLHAP